jgi:selenocysteine-specific elongation factor
MAVKLFVGAAEVMARTRVLGEEAIAPGETGWLQLALAAPVAVVRGDRYILRQPSPGMTLGGGRVLDPYPGRRYRRFRPEVAARMETLAAGTPSELLLQALRRSQPTDRPPLFRHANLGATAAGTLEQLLAEGQVVEIGQQLMSRDAREALQERAVQIVGEYHRQTPLRIGVGRELLRSRLKVPATLFAALLEHLIGEGQLEEKGTAVRLPSFRIEFDPAQQAAVERLMERFAAAGVNSPSVKESKAAVGEAVYSALLDLGMLHPLNEEVVYATAEYEALVAQLQNYLREKGRMNAAEARDLLGTTRKYAIALLEHLDDLRITRRVGDVRELVGR